MRGCGAAWPWLLLALVAGPLAVAPRAADAQDLTCEPGDVEVRDVKFVGNRTLPSAELASVIATTPSAWGRRKPILRSIWGLRGTKRCLDPAEFPRDVYRLQYYYQQRGFYHTRVDTSRAQVGNRADAIEVTFRITEGPPVILTELTVTGLDSVEDGARMMRRLRQLQGDRYDRVRFQQRVDAIMERLQNIGYPRPDRLNPRDIDTIQNVATVAVNFLPGRVAHIGRIAINDIPAEGKSEQIPKSATRKLLRFKQGDLYRAGALFESQRSLYQLETFRHVEIGLDSLQPAGDSLVNVLVTVSETDMRTVRTGVGWATLDCFRTQAQYTHRNVLGKVWRVDANARMTKIANGYPLDFAKSLCTRKVQGDRFSDTLNYFGGVTFTIPGLLGSRWVPTITGYSERRSEFRAYQRTTPIGLAGSVTRELSPRLPFTLGYQFEGAGRTDADAGVFCAVFNVCDLGDIATLREARPLGIFNAVLSRNTVDNEIEPGRGSVLRGEFRHASKLIGSDRSVQFNKWLGSATKYRRVNQWVTVAGRLQAGGVLAISSFQGNDRFIPPQERLYGGGPSSVRGYEQNELGPVVYIVDSFRCFERAQPKHRIACDADESVPGTQFPDGAILRANPRRDLVRRASPTGGNALLVGNLEGRFRIPGLVPQFLQFALFADVGQVYNRGTNTVSLKEFRWTPGFGTRVASPVGPIRFDFAYNGYPRRAGQAFFIDAPGTPGRALRCVSPTSDFSDAPNAGIGGTCATSYTPPSSKNFFRRWNFHFSIGQAF